MQTGPALITVLHRQKKAGQPPSRPMSAPAMSAISGNRLSYGQAGSGRTGEKKVIKVGHNLEGPQELMSFRSLLKQSAPKGKGRAKPKKGSLGVSPLAAPHSTSAGFLGLDSAGRESQRVKVSLGNRQTLQVIIAAKKAARDAISKYIKDTMDVSFAPDKIRKVLNNMKERLIAAYRICIQHIFNMRRNLNIFSK